MFVSLNLLQPSSGSKPNSRDSGDIQLIITKGVKTLLLKQVYLNINIGRLIYLDWFVMYPLASIMSLLVRTGGKRYHMTLIIYGKDCSSVAVKMACS